MIPGYCDIHSHILYGVDDGAVSIDEVSRMLSIAYSEGIRCMVATPHFIADGTNVSEQIINEIYENVLKEAKKISPDFQIFLGHELYHSQDVIKYLQRGEAFTINKTDYILVEFWPRISYRDMWNSLQEYLYHGYYPILAHAERYIELLKKPERVHDIVRSGIYIQLNFSSLLGRHSESDFCHKLLKKDWVHFLGSDTHGATIRPPYAREAADLIRKKYGIHTYEKLLWENPMAMLKNIIIK